MHRQDDKLRDLVAEQAAQWHVAQAAGGLDAGQAREFMRWLRLSRMHVAEYLAVACLERDLVGALRASDLSLEDLQDEVAGSVRPFRRSTIDADIEDVHALSPRAYHDCFLRARHIRSIRHVSRRRQWAAVVAAVAMAGAVALASWQGAAPVSIGEKITTGYGQVRSLHLQDGTLLQLDVDSAVTIRFDRRRRRVVVDRGRAYFEVTRDSGRPFSVRVGRSLIRDIGTAFDVDRRPAGTTITVAQGRIQVWRSEQGESDSGAWRSWLGGRQPLVDPIASLGAGQQVRVNGTGRVVALGKVDVEQSLAWTRGLVAFDNEAVAVVADKFNRYNKLQIGVADPRIAALKISGTFDVHDTSAFLTFLGSLPGVVIDIRAQRAIVHRQGAAHGQRD